MGGVKGSGIENDRDTRYMCQLPQDKGLYHVSQTDRKREKYCFSCQQRYTLKYIPGLKISVVPDK